MPSGHEFGSSTEGGGRAGLLGGGIVGAWARGRGEEEEVEAPVLVLRNVPVEEVRFYVSTWQSDPPQKSID
jgi:hypothetical protein